MNAWFADTTFYLALLNAGDQYHPVATRLAALVRGRTVTTTWVLTEVADALSRPFHRVETARFISDLRNDPRVFIPPPSSRLFDEGLQLYAERPDKEWPLTDCISFVVMRQQGLAEALSADHHFEQAGFVILMK
jgi:predicted nucleic acid-binding protein